MINREDWIEGLEAVVAIVEDVRLKIEGGVMKVSATDEANVVLVEIEQEIELGDEEIGIDVNRLLKQLKLMKGREVDVEVGDASKIVVRDEGIEYMLMLLSLDNLKPMVTAPELEWSSVALVDGGLIRDAIRASKAIGELVELVVEGGKLSMSVEGDGQKMVYLLGVVEGADFKVGFGVEYLKWILLEGLRKVPEVTLEVGAGRPLRVTSAIAGGRARYLVAPRIEAEV